MKKYLIYGSIAAISLAMVFFVYLWPIVYNISPIQSFDQVTQTFETVTTDSLVVFDVDDTVMVPSEKMYWSRIILKNQDYLKKVGEEALKKGTKPEEYYMSITQAKDNPILVEPNIVETIKSLQAKGIKVIALTAVDSGAEGVIPSLPEWRYEKLKTLGIDFRSEYFPDVELTQMTNDKGLHPVFYKGILLSGSFSKGKVLGAFLDQLNWKPKEVIFFDDNMIHLKEVAKAMKERAIPFTGFEYLGADLLPGEIDKDVTEFQLNYLVEHETWLSEAEARAMLDKQKESANYAAAK